MKNNFFYKFIIVFILLFQNVSLATTVLIIPQRKSVNDDVINYMEYAFFDIVYKNLLLFSKVSTIVESDSKLDYSSIKSSVSKIANTYNVDIIITYSIQKYRNGYTLNTFIYNLKKPKSWNEYVLYSLEEDFYKSINNSIKEIYNYSGIEYDTKNYHELSADEYLSLAVYYNDLVYLDMEHDNSLFNRFNTFHKDNLYFNMDYLSLLNNNGDDREYEKVVNEIGNIISKKHHYIDYMYALKYYNNYKKSGVNEDINKSINYIKKAVGSNNRNFNYYNTLGDIYLLDNNYSNSISAYKEALNIYNKDMNAIENLLFVYMKDVDKYIEEIIEYSNILIELDIVKEDVIEVLISMYKKAGDRDSELYYSEILLEYFNKEIARIKANQLGASLLYKYSQKQKNIERYIKNIKGIKQ